MDLRRFLISSNSSSKTSSSTPTQRLSPHSIASSNVNSNHVTGRVQIRKASVEKWGLNLKCDPPLVQIKNILPGSPIIATELQAGDRITSINGLSLENLISSTIHSLFKLDTLDIVYSRIVNSVPSSDSSGQCNRTTAPEIIVIEDDDRSVTNSHVAAISQEVLTSTTLAPPQIISKKRSNESHTVRELPSSLITSIASVYSPLPVHNTTFPIAVYCSQPDQQTSPDPTSEDNTQVNDETKSTARKRAKVESSAKYVVKFEPLGFGCANVGDEVVEVLPPYQDSPQHSHTNQNKQQGESLTTMMETDNSLAEGEFEVEFVGGNMTIFSDMPHQRESCSVHPFTRDPPCTDMNMKYCSNCFCYVCDTPCNVCIDWSRHCNASHKSGQWKSEHNALKSKLLILLPPERRQGLIERILKPAKIFSATESNSFGFNVDQMSKLIEQTKQNYMKHQNTKPTSPESRGHDITEILTILVNIIRKVSFSRPLSNNSTVMQCVELLVLVLLKPDCSTVMRQAAFEELSKIDGIDNDLVKSLREATLTSYGIRWIKGFNLITDPLIDLTPSPVTAMSSLIGKIIYSALIKLDADNAALLYFARCSKNSASLADCFFRMIYKNNHSYAMKALTCMDKSDLDILLTLGKQVYSNLFHHAEWCKVLSLFINHDHGNFKSLLHISPLILKSINLSNFFQTNNIIYGVEITNFNGKEMLSNMDYLKFCERIANIWNQINAENNSLEDEISRIDETNSLPFLIALYVQMLTLSFGEFGDDNNKLIPLLSNGDSQHELFSLIHCLLIAYKIKHQTEMLSIAASAAQHYFSKRYQFTFFDFPIDLYTVWTPKYSITEVCELLSRRGDITKGNMIHNIADSSHLSNEELKAVFDTYVSTKKRGTFDSSTSTKALIDSIILELSKGSLLSQSVKYILSSKNESSLLTMKDLLTQLCSMSHLFSDSAADVVHSFEEYRELLSLLNEVDRKDDVIANLINHIRSTKEVVKESATIPNSDKIELMNKSKWEYWKVFIQKLCKRKCSVKDAVCVILEDWNTLNQCTLFPQRSENVVVSLQHHSSRDIPMNEQVCTAIWKCIHQSRKSTLNVLMPKVISSDAGNVFALLVQQCPSEVNLLLNENMIPEMIVIVRNVAKNENRLIAADVGETSKVEPLPVPLPSAQQLPSKSLSSIDVWNSLKESLMNKVQNNLNTSSIHESNEIQNLLQVAAILYDRHLFERVAGLFHAADIFDHDHGIAKKYDFIRRILSIAADQKEILFYLELLAPLIREAAMNCCDLKSLLDCAALNKLRSLDNHGHADIPPHSMKMLLELDVYIDPSADKIEWLKKNISLFENAEISRIADFLLTAFEAKKIPLTVMIAECIDSDIFSSIESSRFCSIVAGGDETRSAEDRLKIFTTLYCQLSNGLTNSSESASKSYQLIRLCFSLLLNLMSDLTIPSSIKELVVTTLRTVSLDKVKNILACTMQEDPEVQFIFEIYSFLAMSRELDANCQLKVFLSDEQMKVKLLHTLHTVSAINSFILFAIESGNYGILFSCAVNDCSHCNDNAILYLKLLNLYYLPKLKSSSADSKDVIAWISSEIVLSGLNFLSLVVTLHESLLRNLHLNNDKFLKEYEIFQNGFVSCLSGAHYIGTPLTSFLLVLNYDNFLNVVNVIHTLGHSYIKNSLALFESIASVCAIVATRVSMQRNILFRASLLVEYSKIENFCQSCSCDIQSCGCHQLKSLAMNKPSHMLVKGILLGLSDLAYDEMQPVLNVLIECLRSNQRESIASCFIQDLNQLIVEKSAFFQCIHASWTLFINTLTADGKYKYLSSLCSIVNKTTQNLTEILEEGVISATENNMLQPWAAYVGQYLLSARLNQQQLMQIILKMKPIAVRSLGIPLVMEIYSQLTAGGTYLPKFLEIAVDTMNPSLFLEIPELLDILVAGYAHFEFVLPLWSALVNTGNPLAADAICRMTDALLTVFQNERVQEHRRLFLAKYLEEMNKLMSHPEHRLRWKLALERGCKTLTSKKKLVSMLIECIKM